MITYRVDLKARTVTGSVESGGKVYTHTMPIGKPVDVDATMRLELAKMVNHDT